MDETTQATVRKTTGPRYLEFTIRFVGGDAEVRLIDKEKYPNCRWEWIPEHEEHPAMLMLNLEPGQLRYMYITAQITAVKLEMYGD